MLIVYGAAHEFASIHRSLVHILSLINANKILYRIMVDDEIKLTAKSFLTKPKSVLINVTELCPLWNELDVEVCSESGRSVLPVFSLLVSYSIRLYYVVFIIK